LQLIRVHVDPSEVGHMTWFADLVLAPSRKVSTVVYLSAEARRQSIVDAAIEVIAAEGLQRATTRRIAEKADAPLGALHYCFKNKEELIKLVADQGAAKLQEAFTGVDPSLGVAATIRD